jgi:hypothetical protein
MIQDFMTTLAKDMNTLEDSMAMNNAAFGATSLQKNPIPIRPIRNLDGIYKRQNL